MKLEITEEQNKDGYVQLTVNGEVNIHTSPKLRERLKPLLNESNSEVHVLLDGVHFMDSSGIATLVEGLQWSRTSGGRFVLSGLTPTVRDVFSLAKLDTVFEIVESSESA